MPDGREANISRPELRGAMRQDLRNLQRVYAVGANGGRRNPIVEQERQ